MQIKTQDGMASVASAGVGGAGLGLGIGGVALGLLNSANNGNGLLGGLFGGGNNCNALMSELAKEKAEYVTAHIHEDGIYKALEHYHLI